jgi:hypothetical protein
VAAVDGGVHPGAAPRRDAVRGVPDQERAVAEQGELRADVTVEQAADLLWLLTSFDQLFTGRGMSADQVAETLVSTAERSLCRPVWTELLRGSTVDRTSSAPVRTGPLDQALQSSSALLRTASAAGRRRSAGAGRASAARCRRSGRAGPRR